MPLYRVWAGKTSTSLEIWVICVATGRPLKSVYRDQQSYEPRLYNKWCTIIFSENNAESEGICECIYVRHVVLNQHPSLLMVSSSKSLGLSDTDTIDFSEWELTRNGK